MNWLADVLRILHDEEQGLADATYVEPTPEVQRQIELLLRPTGARAEQRAVDLRWSLKQHLEGELHQHFGTDPAFPSNHLTSLIYRGWDGTASDGTRVHVDWFDLLCDFFHEEYKENESLRAIVEGQLLANIAVEGIPSLAAAVAALLERWSRELIDRLDRLQETAEHVGETVDVHTGLLQDLKTGQERIEMGLNRAQQHPPMPRPIVPEPDAEALAAARHRLAALDPDVIPTPDALPAGSWVPITPSPVFLGREAELSALAQALGVATNNQERIVAITGIGGMGKTQLACEFAYRFGRYFAGGIYWLSFATPADIPSQITACGGAGRMALHPAFADLPLDDQERFVRAAWKSPLPRLLVFDNCEDPALLARYKPGPGGSRVLVTSLRAAWPPLAGVHVLPLHELTRPASRQLLCTPRAAVCGEPIEHVMADPAVDAICDLVGDLPLALALAAAYVATYPTLSLEEYRAKLQNAVEKEALLEERSLTGLVEGELPTNHRPHVAATFALSYQQLDAAQPVDALALTLLHHAARLAPAPIPRSLLLRTAGIDPATVAADGPEADALRRLAALGLLDEDDDGALRLHRLLAAFVRGATPGIAAEVQAAVERSLLAEARGPVAAGQPAALLPLQVHLRAVTDAALPRADEGVAALCSMLGTYLYLLAAYGQAQPYLERALQISERVLGPEHPTTATSLNNLAGLLQDQGDYAAARPLYERALQVRERVLGPEHPDTAGSLNNLALLLQDQGDYATAHPLFERTLVIWQRRDDRAREVVTFYALGAVAAQLGQADAALDLLAVCMVIGRATDQPDAEVRLRLLRDVAAGWGASAEQVDERLDRVARAYALDRGWSLIEAAHGAPPDDGSAR